MFCQCQIDVGGIRECSPRSPSFLSPVLFQILGYCFERNLVSVFLRRIITIFNFYRGRPGGSDRGFRYGVWMFTSMTFATSRIRSGAVLTNSSSGIRLVGVERLIAP